MPNIIHKSKCILKLRQQTNSKRKNQIQLGRRFYFKNATKIVKVQVQYFIVPIMLISCISENKIKGRTSIFYRKTEKGKLIRDVDQNYAGKHYLLCHLYQCFQFFHIYTCHHYWVPLNLTSNENNNKTKKITHTNKETNGREEKIMIMEVYKVLPS